MNNSTTMKPQVLTEKTPKNTPKFREDVQQWMKKKNMSGFYDVLQNTSFASGAGEELRLRRRHGSIFFISG